MIIHKNVHMWKVSNLDICNVTSMYVFQRTAGKLSFISYKT